MEFFSHVQGVNGISCCLALCTQMVLPSTHFHTRTKFNIRVTTKDKQNKLCLHPGPQHKANMPSLSTSPPPMYNVCQTYTCDQKTALKRTVDSLWYYWLQAEHDKSRLVSRSDTHEDDRHHRRVNNLSLFSTHTLMRVQVLSMQNSIPHLFLHCNKCTQYSWHHTQNLTVNLSPKKPPSPKRILLKLTDQIKALGVRHLQLHDSLDLRIPPNCMVTDYFTMR